MHLQKKIHYLTVNLDLGVTRNVAQYPLHHVTYLGTKFEVTASNCLGGDTFTRSVTGARKHGRTDISSGSTLFAKTKMTFRERNTIFF